MAGSLAWGWTPLRAVCFLLEVGAGDEGLRQIRRVLDDRGHSEPFGAVGHVPIEILGHHRVVTVGHAIPAEVTGPHVRRHDLEGTARGRPGRAAAGTAAAAAADG